MFRNVGRIINGRSWRRRDKAENHRQMPSGYENSPDYGGGPPNWKTYAIALVLLGAFVAAYFFFK
jgi:hypothetical protein